MNYFLVFLLGPISVGGAFIMNSLGFGVPAIVAFTTLIGFLFGRIVG